MVVRWTGQLVDEDSPLYHSRPDLREFAHGQLFANRERLTGPDPHVPSNFVEFLVKIPG